MFPAYAGMIRVSELYQGHVKRVPRLRGDDPKILAGGIWASSVFPAYAGMIRGRERWTSQSSSVPRLRGDDPMEGETITVPVECSPPTRG